MRENKDQKNSDYGHFSPSDNIKENIASAQMLISESCGCIIFSKQQIIVNSEI